MRVGGGGGTSFRRGRVQQQPGPLAASRVAWAGFELRAERAVLDGPVAAAWVDCSPCPPPPLQQESIPNEGWSPMSEVVVAAAPRLLHRQRLLLSLLRAFGGEMRDCDFQRLLFDYSRRCRERGVDAPYDFVAQEQGPRSFTAAADRDRLARHGILVSGAWHFTAEGRLLAGKLKNRDVAVFAARQQRRGDASGTDGDRQAPVGGHGRNEAPVDNGSPNSGLLATIGYEGRSYEAYFNQLLRVGISRVREDGTWVRLYPAPFRRLDEREQYRPPIG